MHKFKLIALAALAQIAFLSTAMAAEKCYEEIEVAPALACDGTNSKSADFSTGCKFTPPEIVKKEIDCPARWVNISGNIETHATTCGRVGLKPAEFSGQRCASGERRPTAGSDFGSIVYKFGRHGRNPAGGSTIEYRKFTYGGGGGRGDYNPNAAWTKEYNYCWGAGQKRDYDNSDIVVAYACD